MKDFPGSDFAEAMPVCGIVGDTPIATGAGWCAAESLRPGDAVLTLEAGFQPLLGIRRTPLPAMAPQTLWPVAVPQGALDCRAALVLLPDQMLLIECDQAERLFGDALALIPAAALEGWRGIGRVPHPPGARAVMLEFAAAQVVYASRAVLLSCPGPAAPPGRPADLVAERPPNLADCALSREQARDLITCLIAEDLGQALRGAGVLRGGDGPQAARAAGAKRP